MIAAALLIQSSKTARDVLIAGVAAAILGEVAATYAGQRRHGGATILGSVTEAVFLWRRSGEARTTDAWTKQILVGGVVAGAFVAYLLARDKPSLRAGANNWLTLGIGIGIALAGIALRSWAVFVLGRFFRREVAVEQEQTVVEHGPYRLIRHPAYAGNLLTFAGLGLAIGSWVSALVLLAITFAATLPRIHVEEETLQRELGRGYTDYRGRTKRLVPSVW